MSFPLIDFLTFVFIPLGLFSVFGYIIFYHLKKYGIRGDNTENTAYFFAIILFLISLFIIIFFFSIDWNSISPNDFIKESKIKFNSLN